MNESQRAVEAYMQEYLKTADYDNFSEAEAWTVLQPLVMEALDKMGEVE